MVFKRSNLEALLTPLRIQLGDTGTTPTYSDEVLHSVLGVSLSALMPRWNDRYYMDQDGVAHRNPYGEFDFSTPPEIQSKDWRAIVLQASIMIKSGAKFAASGNAVSWRDEEISYSNIESARQRSSTLNDDIKELDLLFPVKLARAKSGRLYGFGQNKDWDK